MTNSKTRSNALTDRLLIGAKKLVEIAEGISDAEWNSPVLGDGRSVGVVVHQVGKIKASL